MRFVCTIRMRRDVVQQALLAAEDIVKFDVKTTNAKNLLCIRHLRGANGSDIDLFAWMDRFPPLIVRLDGSNARLVSVA